MVTRCHLLPPATYLLLLLLVGVVPLLPKATKADLQDDTLFVSFNTPHCRYSKDNLEIVCNYTNNRRPVVMAPHSPGPSGPFAIRLIGASRLRLHPGCMEEVRVVASTNVSARDSDTTCDVKLFLQNSTVTELLGGFTDITLADTSVEVMAAGRVGNVYLLPGSTVGRLQTTMTKWRSNIKESHVGLIEYLKVEGRLTFFMVDSRMDRVRHFAHTSSSSTSSLRNSSIGWIGPRGFVVSSGKLTMRSVVLYDLEDQAIVVGGHVVLEECHLVKASHRSILVLPNGTLTMRLTSFDGRKRSLDLLATTESVFPLVLFADLRDDDENEENENEGGDADGGADEIMGEELPPTTWGVAGMAAGVVVGFGFGVLLLHLGSRWRTRRSKRAAWRYVQNPAHSCSNKEDLYAPSKAEVQNAYELYQDLPR
ncbi:uncharacterized protein LOC143038382 isoform X2 [Oratosquilla oratoria]